MIFQNLLVDYLSTGRLSQNKKPRDFVRQVNLFFKKITVLLNLSNVSGFLQKDKIGHCRLLD